ncbi:hypothetical membrane protein [Pelotomaculum thermopropionicum SI]|uniref:Hypothetical membrane protein n=1 Tax=Pelotomaculum thermopropionicum (strain DSM 13744 / JCM 10971 / SI) TaxID=370438 RepID=A5D6E9_PELTS|nr:hypothetical membrane protein [Pelotomaculum thermopropionicum SI]
MKLKLGAKIALGFSIVLLLLVIMGLNSIVQTRSISKDVDAIDIINQELSLEKDIEIHFYNGVAGIRGYIAYGKENFRDTYNKELDQVLEMENRLLEIAPADKKAEIQKLIEITSAYHKGIQNDLIPAIEIRYKATEHEAIQAAQKEVERIAGGLVPITGQLTETLRGLTENNNKIFQQKINDTGRNVLKVISISVILSLAALLIGMILSFFISSSIKKPIKEMVDGANRFAQGDFTGEIKAASSDEVGDLARSLNDMSKQLRELISEVVTNAQTLAAHSEELAASGQEVSASIEEVAGTTNEVAAMAEKSMENAEAAAGESRQVIAVAETGNETVQKTIDKINSISQSASRVQEAIRNLGELSAQVGNITNVITGIADQTNLLALNAAIEAARAGDQGRGFAVVAEEVRKLAEQSAGAAKEIGQIINRIQSGVDTAIKSMDQGAAEVREGVSLASEAGNALRDIINAVNNSIVLTEEIATSAKQTSEGMQQLSASNEQVTSTIQQVATATQELAGIANKLQSLVERFKI